MATPNQSNVNIPLEQMTLRQKIREVKRLMTSLNHCIQNEFEGHKREISYEAWTETVAPIQAIDREFAPVLGSLVTEIEALPEPQPVDPPADPPAEAPSAPPGDSVPVNQEDLGATQRERDRLNNQNQQQG